LPPGALARLGTARFRHGYPATSVAFSPDGKILASGEQNRGVHLWDAATGRELARLGERQAPFMRLNGVDALAFSPDGKRIVGGGPSAIVLWDVAAAQELLRFRGHQGKVLSVAYSADDRLVATGGDDTVIRLWDTISGQELRQLAGHRIPVRYVAFSPNGKLLASSGETIRLWDVATGKELRRCDGHRFEVNTVVFSRDGRTLASGSDDKTIRLWDVESGKQLKEFSGGQIFVLSVAFSPDCKKLASAAKDGTIILWEAATGALIRELAGHDGPAASVAFSPDGKVLASAGADKTVRLWDVATGQELRPSSGHQQTVTAAAFSPDGKTVVTGSQDGTVRLWDATTGAEHCRYENTVQGNSLKKNGSPTMAPQAVKPVRAVAFSPDGKILAWAGPHICLRETATEKELRRLGKAGDQTACFSFSPDGKILAAGNPAGWVRLYDVPTGQELRLLAGGYGPIAAMSFSPDGKALALAHERGAVLTVWEVATGNRLLSIQVADHPALPAFMFNTVAFSPDGTKLASGLTVIGPAAFEGHLCLWDARTGQRIWKIQGQFGGNAAVAFSPDGRTLASASGDAFGFGRGDQAIRLWEVATARERCRLKGHRSGMTSIAFAPDGRSLVSAGEDTTAMIWDITGLRAGRRSQGFELTASDLARKWQDLASANAVQAHSAVWTLVAAPKQSLPFLKDHLRPAAPVDRKRVEELIADLGNDRFSVRQQAMQGLERMADRIEGFLQVKLREKLTLETQQRLERLLQMVEPSACPERLREVRAIEVLEQIGTPQAKELLQTLAMGVPEARLTQEAKGSFMRLAKR
jgi:WD40 repeat protein